MTLACYRALQIVGVIIIIIDPEYQPVQYIALHAGTMVNGGLETSLRCSMIKMM